MFSAITLMAGAVWSLTFPVDDQSMSQFLANYPPFARGTFKATIRMSRNDMTRFDSVVEYQLAMDPPKWSEYCRVRSTWLENGKLKEHTLAGERLYPAVGSMSASPDVVTGIASAGVAARIKPLSPDQLKYAGPGVYRFAIDGANTNNDQLTFAELLAVSKCTIEPGVLNGRPVSIILASSQWGKITLWLDPARGHLPLRFLQEKTGDHLCFEGRAVKKDTLDEDGHPSPKIAFSEQFDTTRIEKVAGRLMVTEYVRHEKSRYANGQTKEDTERVALSEIKPVDVWQKDPFVLKSIVPNGAKVTVADDRPIEYVWMDGKIVKAVDQNVVAQVAATEFVPPSRSATRWPWIVGVLLVIGCLVGIWAFKSRKKP